MSVKLGPFVGDQLGRSSKSIIKSPCSPHAVGVAVPDDAVVLGPERDDSFVVAERLSLEVDWIELFDAVDEAVDKTGALVEDVDEAEYDDTMVVDDPLVGPTVVSWIALEVLMLTPGRP